MGRTEESWSGPEELGCQTLCMGGGEDTTTGTKSTE